MQVGRDPPKEAVLGLTLQRAEVGIQCFHLTSDNGTQLAIKGITNKRQVTTFYWKLLCMGLAPANKGLLVRRHAAFGQDFLFN